MDTTTPKPNRRTSPGKRAARQIEKSVVVMLGAEPTVDKVGIVPGCIDDGCRRLEPLDFPE